MGIGARHPCGRHRMPRTDVDKRGEGQPQAQRRRYTASAIPSMPLFVPPALQQCQVARTPMLRRHEWTSDSAGRRRHAHHAVANCRFNQSAAGSMPPNVNR